MPRIVDHDARRIELAAAACEAIFRYGMYGHDHRFGQIDLHIVFNYFQFTYYVLRIAYPKGHYNK